MRNEKIVWDGRALLGEMWRKIMYFDPTSTLTMNTFIFYIMNTLAIFISMTNGIFVHLARLKSSFCLLRVYTTKWRWRAKCLEKFHLGQGFRVLTVLMGVIALNNISQSNQVLDCGSYEHPIEHCKCL